MNTNNVGKVMVEACATSIYFELDDMHVSLDDGRVISVPVNAYWRLREATVEQRLRYRIFGRGTGIRWDEIDEDLSVAGLLRDFGVNENLRVGKSLSA